VEEKPLSFATSRMVTMEAMPLGNPEVPHSRLQPLFLRLEINTEVGGHYIRS